MAALGAYFQPQFTKVVSGAVVPNAAGKVYTYSAGTTTPKTVYKDAAGTVPHTNPILLDADGFPPGGAIFFGTGLYDVTVNDSSDALIRSFDDISAPAQESELSTFEADLADKTSAAKGPALVGYSKTLSYPVGTVGAKLNEIVSVFDFMTSVQKADVQAYTYGQDVTTAITTALASGAKRVLMPAGGYLITSQIVIPNYVTLVGEGYGLFAGNGATRILKRGAFTGVVLNGASQLENLSVEGDTGNTLDGIQMLGGRSVLRNVGSFGHGRDGIKIGDYAISAANTNLWRAFNVIARSNTRHGMRVSHDGETLTPDANAGILMGFEASYNGADGLNVGEAVDNQFYGVCCQSNTGYGIHLAQYARGNYIPAPYTEANTAGGVILDSGADRNHVLGYRAGLTNDEITNNGADNTIQGRYGAVASTPLHRAAEAFQDLRFLETTTSGIWQVTKLATSRHLSVDLTGTSAGGDVMIQSTGGGASGLRFAVGTHDAAMRGLKTRAGVSLNFGSIGAGASIDVAVTMTGADSTYTYTASPTFAVTAGISWCAYWDGAAVKVRCTNSTGGAISVSGAFNVTAVKAA